MLRAEQVDDQAFSCDVGLGFSSGQMIEVEQQTEDPFETADASEEMNFQSSTIGYITYTSSKLHARSNSNQRYDRYETMNKEPPPSADCRSSNAHACKYCTILLSSSPHISHFLANVSLESTSRFSLRTEIFAESHLLSLC